MSPREVFESVDDAVYAMTRFGPRPLKAVAAAMGLTEKALQDVTDPQRKPRFGASLLVPLTLATGSYAAIKTICRLVGGTFVLLPRSQAHEADVLEALAEVLREVGEDAEQIGRAIADNGRLDAHEAPGVLQNIDESMARLATLREVVARRCPTAQAPAPRAVSR